MIKRGKYCEMSILMKEENFIKKWKMLIKVLERDKLIFEKINCYGKKWIKVYKE